MPTLSRGFGSTAVVAGEPAPKVEPVTKSDTPRNARRVGRIGGRSVSCEGFYRKVYFAIPDFDWMQKSRLYVDTLRCGCLPGEASESAVSG